jgi:hypothetical protein
VSVSEFSTEGFGGGNKEGALKDSGRAIIDQSDHQLLVNLENTSCCWKKAIVSLVSSPKKECSWICRDQQIETISTKLPMDKSDLNTFFPKYSHTTIPH